MDELCEYNETPVDGRWYGETIPLSRGRMVSFYKDRRVRVWHRDSSQSVELDAVDAWELYEALGYYAGDLRKLAQAAYWSRKSADPFVFLPSPQGLVPVLFWTDGLKNAVIQAMKGYKDDGGSDQTIDLPEG